MPEYRTPGVYIEEISTGPRPVAASATTDTGFVGIITLPDTFLRGRGKAAGMFLPAQEEVALLAWNRALAFRGLLPYETSYPPARGAAKGAAKDPDKDLDKDLGKDPGKPPTSSAPRRGRPAGENGSQLSRIVKEVLPGRWQIDAPNGSDMVTMRGEEGAMLHLPVRRTLMSVKTRESGQREWDLAWGANEQEVVQLIAGRAIEQGISHTGNLGAVDPSAKPQPLNISAVQEQLQRTAPAVQSLDALDQWRREMGRQLFLEIWTALSGDGSTRSRADSVWMALSAEARGAWDGWVRAHPGMRRLELALIGFFENGGKTAHIAVGVQAAGAAGPTRRKFLEDSFDGITDMAMLCAPGLEFEWQQAILEYAGPRGRGDLFAVLETPRYLTTRAASGIALNPFRWTEAGGPYEMVALETLNNPQLSELRFGGFSADEILDRCIPRDDTGYGAAYGPWLVVNNPLSTGAHDRYIIAPPAGHVAGVIAATDLKPGGGVHKAPANEQVAGVTELVTNISDREQEALNTKGINIIRHRSKAGIRIWGARTVATDPLWNYVNVRRLFLFVERSVRDAIQWAVFLPNTPQTRSDLRSTIASFLYRLYMQGMLDGKTWQEAYTIRCDSENNPDADVRAGILTVDVEMRPVYPAEFIRIRFRQSPMRSDIAEG